VVRGILGADLVANQLISTAEANRIGVASPIRKGDEEGRQAVLRNNRPVAPAVTIIGSKNCRSLKSSCRLAPLRP
jgi:hypothetical protein